MGAHTQRHILVTSLVETKRGAVGVVNTGMYVKLGTAVIDVCGIMLAEAYTGDIIGGNYDKGLCRKH